MLRALASRDAGGSLPPQITPGQTMPDQATPGRISAPELEVYDRLRPGNAKIPYLEAWKS